MNRSRMCCCESSQVSRAERDDDYVEGAPELIAEVAASSASYDLHNKLTVYRRSGVQEYIVWRTYDNRLDWFRLREGEYVLLEPDAEGVVRSEIFAGLWLDVPALLEGNLAQVLAVLQSGLTIAEHADFVKRLSGRKLGRNPPILAFPRPGQRNEGNGEFLSSLIPNPGLENIKLNVK